jgi:antitoxin HicB
MGIARTYTIVLEPEAEGGFSVIVPALPEVHTQGENAEDAMTNAREAIALALEVRLDLGEEIPPDDSPRIERVTVDLDAA